MALYRLEFLVSSDVDVTSGTTTVTLNDGQDVSSVVPGTAVFINNQAVEAISGQNISPTQSTITLRYNWPFATVTSGRLVAFNTFEGLNTAITRLNDVINSIPDFTGATGQGFLYNDGTDTYTIKASTVFGESLLNAADASSALSILQSPDYPSFAGQAGVLKKDALDVYSLVTSTAFGESLLSQNDASTARSTLGITDPSAFGQTLITQSDAASARSTLGVVSATDASEGLIRKSTTSEAQASSDDNTAMTPLKVAQQANLRLTQSLIYSIGAGSVFSKQDSNLEGGEIRIEKADNSTLAGNLSIDLNAERLRFFEDGGGARGAFIDLNNCDGGASSKVFHSGILSSLQNASGSTVIANATVAGSSLNPAQDGTWRNISGNDVLNNAYGLFERI
jgi:hypothetical protein